MIQKLGILATTALTQSATAYRSYSKLSSPFVGEHADAHVIVGENRSTHRAMPIADKF